MRSDEQVMSKVGQVPYDNLNERQRDLLRRGRRTAGGKISRTGYMQLSPTAGRDLYELAKWDLVQKAGRGVATHYFLRLLPGSVADAEVDKDKR